MKIFEDFCNYMSKLTSIDKDLLFVVFVSLCIAFVFSIIKYFVKIILRKRLVNNRRIYFINQSSQIILSIVEVLLLLLLWGHYFSSLVTLISFISAAVTIALREVIMNFFCGLYIRFKKPFKVEDRIQIDDLKGDVMNISLLSFELLEVSNKEENGQSTGIVITFPNSVIFSKPIKNINRGFKYVWNELTVKVRLDCDLTKNKQELYKIVNGNDIIKNIPHKMANEIQRVSPDKIIYYNQYDPIIYTKIVDDHVELTIRYLMHPKKARYVESVLWNKIYLAFREGKIGLFLGVTEPELNFSKEEEKQDEKYKPKGGK